MINLKLLLPLLLSWLTVVLHAQEAPKPPAAIASLARLLATKAPAPTDHPTRFKPRARPVMLHDIADALGQDAEQRTALRQVIVEGAKTVEAQLAAAGHPNDVAAALAFSIAVHWGLWQSAEVSDPASEALLAQLHVALATPEFRALSNLDKQRAYEYGIGLGVFTAVMVEAAEGDADTLAGAKTFAGEALTLLLGVDPATMQLGDSGLQIVGAGAPLAAETQRGAPLTVAIPAGWTSAPDADFSFVSKSMPTQNSKGEPLTVRVLVSKQGAPATDIESLVHTLYGQMLRPLIPADAMRGDVLLRDARPDVCRRYVGNGLRCMFAGVSWGKHEDGIDYLGTEQELHLYVVESGGAWYPIIVQLLGMKGPLPNSNETIFGHVRHEWIQEVFVALRGEASKEPLFTSAEFVGHWELAGTTTGPFYYNAVTGASLGLGMVVRNHKIDCRADGTWSSVFSGGAGIGSIAILTERDSGTWQLENDGVGTFMVRTRRGGSVDRARLVSRYALPDGRSFLAQLGPNDPPSLPRVWGSADRYFRAK